MYSYSFFSRLFGIQYRNPDLYRAQHRAVARQAPLLYLIILTAIIAVASINLFQAPFWVTVVMPGSMLTSGLLYATWDLREVKRSSRKARNIAALVRLHSTVWISAFLGLTFAAWTILLFKYGNERMWGLNTAFISISLFGAALCLIHLRIAAFAVVIFMTGPIILFFWQTGIPAYMTSAANMGVVAGVFMILINWHSRDFSQLVEQQRKVKEEQAKVDALNRKNAILANTDNLTALPNRRHFLSTLHDQVNNVSLGQKNGLAVGILDLDGFKQINDIYGHPTGDQVLKNVGSRLEELICKRVFIARLGGDEFGILISGNLNDEELVEIGSHIIDVLLPPFEIGGRHANLGGTIGFAAWKEYTDSGHRLFEKADYALYYAKEKARGTVAIFNERHAETIREASILDSCIQSADFDEEMHLLFQPIISNRDSRVAGFEALARWQSPVLGKIKPDIFIDAAERTGVINKLTSVLFAKALEEAKNWPDDIFVSFNLSMHDITSSTVILNLVSIVNKSGINPKRITFEITETAVMSNYDTALNSLNLLKSMGSKVALDDFGTGQSSLSYVRKLPLNKLKLDRSFVGDLEKNEEAGSIVDMMIEMCRSLKIECIVEGVETLGQLSILESMGCENIQGFYYSKPISGLDALRFINSGLKSKDQAGRAA